VAYRFPCRNNPPPLPHEETHTHTSEPIQYYNPAATVMRNKHQTMQKQDEMGEKNPPIQSRKRPLNILSCTVLLLQ